MTLRRSVTLVLIVCLGPIASRLFAQSPSAPPPNTRRAGAIEGVDVMVSADVGAPAKLSAGLGIILVTSHLPESRRGLALNLEAGQGAGRVSVGAIEYDYMGSAMQLRASVLRTWRDPWRVGGDQTFVGPELRFSPLLITFGVGYYWRTAGSVPGDGRFFAPTIGLRL